MYCSVIQIKSHIGYTRNNDRLNILGQLQNKLENIWIKTALLTKLFSGLNYQLANPPNPVTFTILGNALWG
jgi:hypothetical protein